MLTGRAGGCYETVVKRPARAALLTVILSVLLAACSTGSTEVEGVDGEATGGTTAPTAPTGTTAAATGPTATTGVPDGFDGAVSLDIPPGKNPTGAVMYSCDGVEGTWTYEPGELTVQGIEFTTTAGPVDMSGGTGTLVIEGTVTIPGAGEATFTDTIDLEIRGTADAPTMASSGVKVNVSGVLEGIPINFGDFFPENAEFPIEAGAAQC